MTAHVLHISCNMLHYSSIRWLTKTLHLSAPGKDPLSNLRTDCYPANQTSLFQTHHFQIKGSCPYVWGRQHLKFCIPTFGTCEWRLGSLAPVTTVVFIEGQTMLASPGHHVSVGLQVFGASQALGSVDFSGVCVRHVQLTSHGIGCQVVAVCRVVTAIKKCASVRYHMFFFIALALLAQGLFFKLHFLIGKREKIKNKNL